MRERLRIGLLVDFLVSEYSEFLMKGVHECCKKVNAECIIFPMGELNNHAKNFDYQCVSITAFISEKNIDGIIFVSTTQTHHLEFEAFISYINSYYPIPMVNISAEVPGIPSVYVNYEKAFYALIEHVVCEVGAKKIGFMTVDSQSDEVVLREKIFWQVMKDYNIPFSSVKVWKAEFNYPATMYELNRSEDLSKKFDYDAIICLNDDMAMACLDYIKGRGLSVPDDIVVTGFDNLRKAIFNIPSLSTVDQMVFQQGYVAARTLYDMLIGKKVPMTQSIEAKAILRKSTRADVFFNKVRNNGFIEIDRAALADVTSSYMAYEWYQNRVQLFRMTKMYMNLQSGTTEEDIINRMTHDLHSMGIPYIVVVAYETPIEISAPFDYFHLPHSAKIICSFDKFKGMSVNNFSTEVKFDPNEMIVPEEFMRNGNNPIIAMSLYNSRYQLGYMLIEKVDYDIAVFETLRHTISLMVNSLINVKSSSGADKDIKEKAAVLDKIAHTDEMTGILNRRGLFDFGQKTIDLSKSMIQKGLVIYCDMDGLKKINDNFGHESGDKAIIAEAGILRSSFRTTDIVARIGGDEFVVISPGMKIDYFETLKKKIEERCIKWTEETNSLFLLSISLGAVEYPYEESYDLQTLLSMADSALYAEKRRKKGIK